MRKYCGIIVVAILCAALLFSGCDMSALSDLMPGGSSSAAGTEVRGATEREDGRLVDGYADGRIGDVMTNVFFSFVVNDAALTQEYEGQTPPEGMSYLVADITVKNVFGSPLMIWADEFQIQWGRTEEEYGFPIPCFAQGQMPDEFTLKTAESLTYVCVYEVPTPTKETEYSVSFLEVYQDEVEGNVFFVFFDLGPEDTAMI